MNPIRRTLSALAFLAAFANPSTEAIASQNPADWTVKVQSWLCQQPDHRFNGSGLLLRIQEHDYVLTSEHVVLHGVADFCHSISGASVKNIVRADLRAVDFATGMALLKLSKPLENAAPPTLDIFEPQTPNIGQKLTVAGYPAKSDELLVPPVGDVLKNSSSRHEIPLISKVIETIGAHGEYGMSGGPAWSQKGGKNGVIGMLSHQYLSMRPGTATQVAEWQAEENRQYHSSNFLILIPSKSILRWIGEVIKAPSAAPFLLRDPYSQLQGKSVVLMNEVRVEYIAGSIADPTPIGGDGTGIGGDGTGIGGDGTGIGGQSSFQASGAMVQLSQAGTPASTRWLLSMDLKWLEHSNPYLARGEKAQIPYFVLTSRKPGTRIQVRGFHSLSEFFSIAFNDSQWKPVVLSMSAEHKTVPRNILQQAQELEKVAQSLLQQWVANKDAPPTLVKARAGLSEALILAEILQSETWETVQAKDFSSLADSPAFQESWRLLFHTDFDTTVELLRYVRDLESSLDKIAP